MESAVAPFRRIADRLRQCVHPLIDSLLPVTYTASEFQRRKRHLDPDRARNRQEQNARTDDRLCAMLGAIGVTPTEAARFLAEARSVRLRPVTRTHGPDLASPMCFEDRYATYALTRAVAPRRVIETGIAHGVSSTFVLAALAANDTDRKHAENCAAAVPTICSAPPSSCAAPPSSCMAPVSSCVAPASSCMAPVSNRCLQTPSQPAPASSCAAPASSCVAPASSCVAPASSCVAPASSCVAPVSNRCLQTPDAAVAQPPDHPITPSRLVSIDRSDDPRIGQMVPPELHDRWTTRIGNSLDLLPDLLAELGTIDLFIHDSLHHHGHVRREFDLVWPHLRPGGVLLAHDILQNNAFPRFIRRHAADIDVAFANVNMGLIRKRG